MIAKTSLDDIHIKRLKPSIARLKKAARLAHINSKNWVTLASSKQVEKTDD